jgi:hypothetical protein
MRGATLTYFGERVGGDQIVEIDGGAVRTVNDVLHTLDQHAPGGASAPTPHDQAQPRPKRTDNTPPRFRSEACCCDGGVGDR